MIGIKLPRVTLYMCNIMDVPLSIDFSSEENFGIPGMES